MKKIFYCLTAVILAISLFSACNSTEKNIVTYNYPNKTEKILPISIEKTEYLDDMVKIYFSQDAFSEDVVSVRCINENFEEIIDNADFLVENDILTVFSDISNEINGLEIAMSNDNWYAIRYLNSDSYAILEYINNYVFTPDINGDKEAYFTAEEKIEQAEEEERMQKTEEAFALIEGKWYNKEKTKLLDIRKTQVMHTKYNEIGLYECKEYLESIDLFSADIADIIDITSEPVVIECTWNASEPKTINVLLYNNMTEIECELSDERFYKQVEEMVTISPENANS